MDLTLLGKKPIRDEQPAGSDIRYDPFFEELQAEVDKLSTPSAAGAIDWEKIAKLASEILDQKSKDLLVAGYLAVALIYTQRLEGFALGLKVYSDLLEQFWEGLFPPQARIRARVGAIEWWVEKAETALNRLDRTPLAQEKIDSLNANLEKIDQFVRQKVEEPPAFSPLREFINSLGVLSREEGQPEPPLQAPPEPTKPEAAPKPQEAAKAETPAEISSPQEAKEGLDHGLSKIREVTACLRTEDLSNPLAYRLMRMAVWSTVQNLPPATNGRTRIPSPTAYIRNPLTDLKTKGNDEGLVRSAEARIAQCIFWLDLNRWVAEALDRLGESYGEAKETVCQETAFWVHRLAGIEELSFSDGTPFADTETKEWLKKIGIGSVSLEAGPPSPLVSPPTVQDEDPMKREVLEAQALIKKGKLLEAVERFQQRLRSHFSQREILLWRLALSQLLVSANQAKLALPQLDQILKDIEDYRLEEYDPMVALQGLRLAWLGLGSQPDPESKKKAGDVLHRIGKLDLAEVIRLEKKDKQKKERRE